MKKQRRGNGAGCLVKQPSGLFLAKWCYQGKTYTRSTQTHDKSKALDKLNEFVRPFLDKAQIAIIENLEAKVRTSRKTGEIEKLSKQMLIPLTSMFEKYLETLDEPLANGSIESYQTYVWNYIAWMKENYGYIKTIGEVKKYMNEEFLKHLTELKRSTSTYNGHVHTLKRIFKALLSSDSVWDFKAKRYHLVYERRSLTHDEIKLIMSMVENNKDMNLLFNLGLFTGMRLSDCCLIRWEDVDLHDHFINILPLKTKRFLRRILIPIHPKLHKLLSSIPHKEPHGYISEKNARQYKSNAIAFYIRQIFQACKVNDGKNKLGFHTFRHTFVSRCANSGVPLAVVQSIVGHRCIEMTRHYYHMDNGVALKAFRKIAW